MKTSKEIKMGGKVTIEDNTESGRVFELSQFTIITPFLQKTFTDLAQISMIIV